MCLWETHGSDHSDHSDGSDKSDWSERSDEVLMMMGFCDFLSFGFYSG